MDKHLHMNKHGEWVRVDEVMGSEEVFTATVLNMFNEAPFITTQVVVNGSLDTDNEEVGVHDVFLMSPDGYLSEDLRDRLRREALEGLAERIVEIRFG
jgi:hypothetical protein